MNPDSLPIDRARLLHEFDAPGVRAIALLGSHACGTAGPHSDIDLLRLVDGDEAGPEAITRLVEGHLVVVGTATPREVERWFEKPESAVNVIAGLRQGHALVDRDGAFAVVQSRARSFQWTREMQARADRYAGEQMVGLIEEVHKGLAGLEEGHVGKMLNARFGLSWLLNRVVQVQKGILINSDNAFFDRVAETVGRDSAWVRLRDAAFGIAAAEGAPPNLRRQVVAGLRLYAETARLLDAHLPPERRPLVHATVERIELALSHTGSDLATPPVSDKEETP